MNVSTYENLHELMHEAKCELDVDKKSQLVFEIYNIINPLASMLYKCLSDSLRAVYSIEEWGSDLYLYLYSMVSRYNKEYVSNLNSNRSVVNFGYMKKVIRNVLYKKLKEVHESIDPTFPPGLLVSDCCEQQYDTICIISTSVQNSNLSDREMCIIYDFFYNGKSMAELSVKYSVTYERIRQMLSLSSKKIKSIYLEKINDFSDRGLHLI